MSSDDLVREAQDPSTTPARLAELAQADRATWTAIVFNPSAYDGLLQWLGERGDPTVSAALAARAAQVAAQAPAAPPVPEAPPAPPAPPAAPVADAPEPEPQPEPEPVSPVAEPVIAPSAVEQPSPAAEPAAEPTVVIPPHDTTAQQPAHEPTTVFPAQPTEAAAPAADGAGDGTGTTTTVRSLAILVGVVAAVVLLIGGAAFGASKVFGGDDDDSTPSAGSTKSTTAPTPSDEPSDEPSDLPSAVPSITVPTPSGDGASSEFCTKLNDVQQQSMDMLKGGGTDLEQLQARGKQLVTAYQGLEAVAPSDVAGEIRTMADYLEKSMDPSTAGQGDISAYADAAQKVGVYYATNCL